MQFFKDIFTDPSNEGYSMTRTLLFLIILTWIGESIFVVIKTRLISDIPTGIAGLATGLYAFNKMSINIGQKGG
jgi:hypothetical protein